MKTKTILELLTLSSSIYVLARDTQLIDKINAMSEKGKENINKAFSEAQLDANGNELEFVDKLILKTSQLKEELDEKIEELIIKFYKKINVVHMDEIKALKAQLDKSNRRVALMEARLNNLETNFKEAVKI
jgi:polyhydroxyalkanoate synthesis regulator phasin